MKKRQRKSTIKPEKIIIRSKGEFKIKVTDQVYEMNLETGEVRLALMIEEDPKEGLKVFRIKELPMHIYLPAPSKDMASIKFKAVFNPGKYQNKGGTK